MGTFGSRLITALLLTALRAYGEQYGNAPMSGRLFDVSNGFYVQVLPSCHLSGLVVTQMVGFFIHSSLTDPKINSLFNYRENSNDRGRCGFDSTIKFP